jgi:hypothetical protein
LNSKGQFSIIAALLVAVILISTVIVTYSTIRNSPISGQPQVLSAIDETNFAIKQILGFTIGYYGSVLKVTGNSSYAKILALNYLYSGLVNIANMHPEWGTSFKVNESKTELHTFWYTKTSYSTGNLAVTYNLTGLGIYRITYQTSCKLSIQIIKTNSTTQACLNVSKDENEPVINLGKRNFKFYRYIYENSTWKPVSPLNDRSIEAHADGTYYVNMSDPALLGIDPYSYLIQVEDPRGIIVVASSFSRYTCTLAWNETFYSTLQDAPIVVEMLQNGTMRWLGQNIQLTTQAKPIPPIPVKAIHVNQTINGVNHEVPFQIEDWNNNYQVPAGLTSNATVFSNRQMIVFLVDAKTSKVTLWWDGRDSATQTSYAYKNLYFTKDDPSNGILTNGNLKLLLSSTYLYVNGFDSTYVNWTVYGSSPYLNDDTSNYIRYNVNNKKEGWFSFQDLSAAYASNFSSLDQPIGATVTIGFDCKREGSDDYFNFTINDGTTTYGPYSITDLPSDYDWRTYDITNIINTPRKINNARIQVTYIRSGGSASYVYIRRCRLYLNFWLTSILGQSTIRADFMRINSKTPTYGSNLAYIIHHGIIRDVIHQEAEWSNGIPNCPNVYSQIVITLPANATYYTYKLRLMFVQSTQSRNINELCPIKLTASIGSPQTENGISSGFSIVQNGTGTFYNSSSVWQHHWSQIISGTRGTGIMFTDEANKMLYTFDSSTTKTGALKVGTQTIEILPITRSPVSFISAKDVTWYGAVVTFDGTPIYDSSNKSGLWITVEHPPTITVATES